MGKLNKSVISVDEEGGMSSLKTCLSFDEEIEAEVVYAARAGSSDLNSNGESLSRWRDEREDSSSCVVRVRVIVCG